jgi:hypothetical protein
MRVVRLCQYEKSRSTTCEALLLLLLLMLLLSQTIE